MIAQLRVIKIIVNLIKLSHMSIRQIANVECVMCRSWGGYKGLETRGALEKFPVVVCLDCRVEN